MGAAGPGTRGGEAICPEPFHGGGGGQGSTCGRGSEVAVRAGPPGLRQGQGQA
jgi:hypothetical protein